MVASALAMGAKPCDAALAVRPTTPVEARASRGRLCATSRADIAIRRPPASVNTRVVSADDVDVAHTRTLTRRTVITPLARPRLVRACSRVPRVILRVLDSGRNATVSCNITRAGKT